MDIAEYQTLLSQFVTFKSISTDPVFQPEIVKTVDWLNQLFTKHGFTVETLTGSSCNPVIFAHYTQNSKLKTVLVYGHYDVQPAEQADGWLSDPFVLDRKAGRLYGRGVLDNKGQILIHVYTVLDLIKSKKLAYNVKFLIEGNEETANPDLPAIIHKNKSRLKSDYVLVSDGEISGNCPVIESSLRGGFNLTLKYTTAENNLHSGLVGGAVPNAAFELSRFLSQLFDSQNRVNFSTFYDQVDPITDFQLANNKKLLEIADSPIKTSGVNALLTEPNLDFYTQTGLRPTLQITGLKSGYIADGYANIVPATAEARINFRIVASQNPEGVLAAFKKFVANRTPEYVKYEIVSSGMHHPVKLDTSLPIFQTVSHILTQVYGQTPPLKCVGGAIPFIADVKNTLGIDTLSIPLGNEDCNMHGANENFRIELVEKGLKFSRLFFSSAKI